MLDSLKPGQTIQCTVTKKPTNDGGRATLERLMRLDPTIKRGLRSAHRKRQQTLNVYNRGNRDWTSRVKCGKLVRGVKGESWSMRFTIDIADDLRSVAKFVSVKSA